MILLKKVFLPANKEEIINIIYNLEGLKNKHNNF